jgi:hypothetical protein
MPERISKVSHEYAGRQVKVGERFNVDAADVELMVAMGRVERDVEDKIPAFVHPTKSADWPNTYATRDMNAARVHRRNRGARA